MTLAVDTSALVAVILGEADAEVYLSALVSHAGDVHLSAVTLVEAGIVVEAKQGREASDDLQTLLGHVGSTVYPVDASQARAAVAAWRRFGKGKHPAGLNLGDCFSYALARRLSAPLLFKGNDFAQTDIGSAF